MVQEGSMRIEDLRPDQLRNRATRPAGAPLAPTQPVAPADAAARGDTASISAESRARAAAEEEPVAGALAPERTAELRRWLAAGGHNEPDVIRHVAARLIAWGDLDAPPTGDTEQ
jgi:hypothetical protein